MSSQDPPLTRWSSIPLPWVAGQMPTNTSAPVFSSKRPSRSAARGSAGLRLLLLSKITMTRRPASGTSARSASNAGLPSAPFGHPFHIPANATEGIPMLSNAAAFLPPSSITSGSAGVFSHHLQNAPADPSTSAATSAGRASPKRSATSCATSAGCLNQIDRIDP